MSRFITPGRSVHSVHSIDIGSVWPPLDYRDELSLNCFLVDHLYHLINMPPSIEAGKPPEPSTKAIIDVSTSIGGALSAAGDCQAKASIQLRQHLTFSSVDFFFFLHWLTELNIGHREKCVKCVLNYSTRVSETL